MESFGNGYFKSINKCKKRGNIWKLGLPNKLAELLTSCSSKLVLYKKYKELQLC